MQGNVQGWSVTVVITEQILSLLWAKLFLCPLNTVASLEKSAVNEMMQHDRQATTPPVTTQNSNWLNTNDGGNNLSVTIGKESVHFPFSQMCCTCIIWNMVQRCQCQSETYRAKCSFCSLLENMIWKTSIQLLCSFMMNIFSQWRNCITNCLLIYR